MGETAKLVNRWSYHLGSQYKFWEWLWVEKVALAASLTHSSAGPSYTCSSLPVRAQGTAVR